MANRGFAFTSPTYVAISCKVGSRSANFSATISGSGQVIALDLSAGILPPGSKKLSFGSGYENNIRTLYGLNELNPNIAMGWMINRVMDVLEKNPDMLLATIAPRYLVHFTNANGQNAWCHLAGTSEALAAWAAHPVYKALGVHKIWRSKSTTVAIAA